MALNMHKLNHNSLACTKRCLDATDDELEAVVRKLNLRPWSQSEGPYPTIFRGNYTLSRQLIVKEIYAGPLACERRLDPGIERGATMVCPRHLEITVGIGGRAECLAHLAAQRIEQGELVIKANRAAIGGFGLRVILQIAIGQPLEQKHIRQRAESPVRRAARSRLPQSPPFPV